LHNNAQWPRNDMSAGFYSSSKFVPSRSSIIGPVTPPGRWFPDFCISNFLDFRLWTFCGPVNRIDTFLTFVWLHWQANVIITWLYEVVMKPLGLGNVSPPNLSVGQGLAHNIQYLRQEIALWIFKIQILSNLFSIPWFSFV